jgi:cell division septation protein DedD
MAGDNEKQEEIVLGNKQLLSIFFVVVILLGVAFTIGYMIGKNTTAVSAANTPATNVPAPSPDAVTQPARSVSPAATQPAATDADATPAPTDVPRVIGTHPAEPYNQPATKTAAAADPPPAADPAPATESPFQPVSPAATGTYLQVVALKRGDADHMVKVLQDRGFPALLGESPKEGLFRVLVGPFKTMADVAESKQKLRAAGFDPIVAR